MKVIIGPIIKNLRKKQGLTLSQLAEKSNVALATLSRIETGKMTGTVESHMQIARFFGLSLSQFYSEVEKFETSQNESKEKKYRIDMFIYNKGASSTILTKEISGKKMLPVLIELKPGKKTNNEKLAIGTEKILYVLNGKVEITFGVNKEILENGTMLYFDASQPHQIRNIGTKEASCLSITTPINL